MRLRSRLYNWTVDARYWLALRAPRWVYRVVPWRVYFFLMPHRPGTRWDGLRGVDHASTAE